MRQEAFSITMELPESVLKDGLEGLVNMLCDGGCGDASIMRAPKNRFRFAFSRQANSQAHAIYTALKDIHDVVPDAILIEIATGHS